MRINALILDLLVSRRCLLTRCEERQTIESAQSRNFERYVLFMGLESTVCGCVQQLIECTLPLNAYTTIL
jgi:hypothetical protein